MGIRGVGERAMKVGERAMKVGERAMNMLNVLTSNAEMVGRQAIQ